MRSFGIEFLLAFVFISAGGCGRAPSASIAPPASDVAPLVLLSVTSDATEDPQAVDMALKLAGFSLDEGRHVVLFFNVRGVKNPSHALADDFAFEQDEPIKQQLADLIERGVDVHVCPICMKALGVAESDLMEGAQVTTRAGLFSNIRSDTAVLTY
ncbi:MAG: DsrE family protein [Planctomycetales bacterium]|nr:DsrE family protein [Planctomycetales bacterium]